MAAQGTSMNATNVLSLYRVIQATFLGNQTRDVIPIGPFGTLGYPAYAAAGYRSDFRNEHSVWHALPCFGSSFFILALCVPMRTKKVFHGMLQGLAEV